MAAKSQWIARTGLFALLFALSTAVLTAPAQAAPTLAMTEPGARTDGTPTFAGSSSDALDSVAVHVDATVSGEPPRALVAIPEAMTGAWSVQVPQAEALPAETYTATAEQTETLGGAMSGETGTAGPLTFTVDLEPPEVSIVAPPSPSNKTEPPFSGKASEETEVEVHVLEGATQIATATTTASGGEWSTSTLSAPLPTGKHTFTAYATEKSGLGNEKGTSKSVSFEVDTEPPVVSIVGPPSPSKNVEPSFSGEASEATMVEVHVLEGASQIATATTVASGGEWSTSSLSTALPKGKHTFTAYATEKSGLGNEKGTSKSVSFEVDTEPPVVSIVGPPSPSKDTEPPFSGEASEATKVEVHVFEGATEVASASTTAAGGHWSTSTLSKALPTGKHTFTAYAKEKSGLDNAEGQSKTVSFEVDTEPPVVSIVGPPSPSNDTEPPFSGEASEATEVEVHVLEGATQVATATTTAAGGEWSTSSLSAPLPKGKHTFTAYATEKSKLGNEKGTSKSVTFEVDTEPPVVSIVGPSGPSKDTEPPFSGEASEATKVEVHVFEGSTEVASASTTAAGGHWSTSTLSKELPKGKHTFTAYAKEKSGLGNAEGQSKTVSFEVNTDPPEVSIGQPVPLDSATPTFSGTASEETEVEVRVFEGPTEVATATTTASGGKWSTNALSKPLPAGRHAYTAYAKEKSGLGNLEGQSGTVSFEIDTEPPEVSIVAPPSPSKNTEPSFSGEASEATKVEVHVFEGGTEVASASTTAAGGKWSTSGLSKELPKGKHTFTAYATEKSGFGDIDGKSGTVSFEVNTDPPVVSIVAPPSPSKDTEPSFSGEASEATKVEVHVFEGGTEVASASTTAAGGHWSTSTLSKELPKGKHTFTAYAKEKSGLGNAEGQSKTVSFEVNTEPPEVSIVAPPSPSNKTEPPFSGEASEATKVEVHVFEGSTEVASASTTASGGHWSTSGLSKALPTGKHTFTAYAKEQSGLGNAEGQSKTVSFEVNTEPPEVSINQPKSPSNILNPSFSGEASEATKVEVHVFEGAVEVGSQSTTAAGGKWSLSLSKGLPPGKHTFTAYAKEKSGLGNLDGQSGTVSFEVNTEPPEVSIMGPPSPSNNTKPSFSGDASEATVVEVHVHTPEGEVTGSTTASGGKWSLSSLSKELPKGKHTFTAYATEKSGLGNQEGESKTVTFEVNTEPPEVSIVAPPSPSNNTEPPFGGDASEATKVEVHVFEGTSEVASASTTAAGGKWSTSGLSKVLPKGKRTFTAYAKEKSGLGNAEGQSKTVSFEVNTEPPVVSIVAPPSPSNNLKPSFSGEASEATAVEVHVHTAEGEITGSTTASGGKWSLSSLSKELPKGKHTFTAYATEKSGLGNPEGESKPVTFEVNTEPPAVTVQPPPIVSNETTPAFSGTASETKPVTVEVFKGERPEGTPVVTLIASVAGGAWQTAHLTSALANETTYTVRASEESSLGNPTGFATPQIFTINTNAPDVELKPPPSPSNKTEPAFSGTVKGPAGATVTVYVHEGASAQGIIVATASGTISHGSWGPIQASPALKSGQHTYTAVAAVPSSIGNGEGRSNPVTFVVNTDPPTVMLLPLTSPSNDATPSFAGTASEKTQVVVSIYRGAKPEGPVVAKAETAGTEGAWTTKALGTRLEDGEYTAVARQESAIGNGPGVSGAEPFTIDTQPPHLTLNAIPTPSSDRVPSFSGTATDTTPVTVDLYRGGSATGTPVVTLTAEVSAGSWYSGAVSTLEWGEYTVVATEPSSLGNPTGASSTFTFVVAQISPGVITESVTTVEPTWVELTGAVDPRGAPVSECYFEVVGPSYGYSRRVVCNLVTGGFAFPPTGVGYDPVIQRFFGLRPSTSYQYRSVAVSEGGTGIGAWKTFTTLARPGEGAATTPKPSGNSGIGVAAFFATQLKPTGPGARIRALLKRGYYQQRLKAPEAGTATISWYYLPPGAKLARAKHKKKPPPPVLVARGTVSFHAAGYATVKLRLTGSGRNLLKHASRLRLTATCTFIPAGSVAVTTSGTFQLLR